MLQNKKYDVIVLGNVRHKRYSNPLKVIDYPNLFALLDDVVLDGVLVAVARHLLLDVLVVRVLVLRRVLQRCQSPQYFRTCNSIFPYGPTGAL